MYKFNLQHFAAGDVVNTTAGVTNANTGEHTPGNGEGGLSGEMRTYYSDYLIDMAEPKLVHDQFGQKCPIPKNGGKIIEFNIGEFTGGERHCQLFGIQRAFILRGESRRIAYIIFKNHRIIFEIFVGEFAADFQPVETAGKVVAPEIRLYRITFHAAIAFKVIIFHPAAGTGGFQPESEFAFYIIADKMHIFGGFGVVAQRKIVRILRRITHRKRRIAKVIADDQTVAAGARSGGGQQRTALAVIQKYVAGNQ